MPSGVRGAVLPEEPLSVSRFRACSARCCLLAVAVGTALGGVAFWSCRRLVLRWLEGQQFRAGLLLFSLAFILISFPWTWGYTLLSLAPGYLYGFQRGLAVLVFGVAVGTLAAHLVTQRWLLAPMGALVRGNAKLSAIIRVLDGTSGLKVVFLARLTPIPFGLQNAVFAPFILLFIRNISISFLNLLIDSASTALWGSFLLRHTGVEGLRLWPLLLGLVLAAISAYRREEGELVGEDAEYIIHIEGQERPKLDGIGL
eukprot:g47557.t1